MCTARLYSVKSAANHDSSDQAPKPDAEKPGEDNNEAGDDQQPEAQKVN